MFFLQDVYFDDESAEVVISSLRLGDEQDRYFGGPCTTDFFVLYTTVMHHLSSSAHLRA